MNTMKHEQLFTDLTPAQAAVVEGGATYFSYPYTTKGVSTYLNIRSGPSTKASITGKWYPGQIKFLQSPAIIKNGFRRFSVSQSMWVSTQFIQSTKGQDTITPRPSGRGELGPRP